jgi:hypothetical protein
LPRLRHAWWELGGLLVPLPHHASMANLTRH